MTLAVPLAITGATGFVGQMVLEKLQASGTQVRALTRRNQASDKCVHWVSGTLADEAALAALVGGTSAVIHIAGLTHTPDPEQFEAVNVAGTANVIAACEKAKVKRLVVVSSLAAREPQLSAYGASKLAAEKLVRASQLDWTIVRPPAVYGPRDTEMFELFRSAKWGFIPLPPRGATSLIHVADLADLLVQLVDAQPALCRKKLFEPDDGRIGGWSHQEMAQAIGESVGRRVYAPSLPQWLLSFAAGIDRVVRGDRAKLTADRVGYMCHPNWVARSSHAVPKPLWAPQISSSEGLAQTAQWYRQADWL